nr:unnamed protein product [Callosobruchus analis]
MNGRIFKRKCCGALDGKHIVIRNAPHSGSEYFNYKGTYSLILFACVDANYCFRYFDIGTNGRANDAAVFAKSSLNAALENVRNTLNFPKDGVFVADDAFPLITYILKPFGRSTHLSRKQKVFNYRLSRARRIVENAFGILVSRFRVFERPIAIGVDKVDVVVKATLALHNWLKTSSGETYTPIGSFDTEDLNTRQIVPVSWRTQSIEARGLVNLQTNLGSRNYTTSASTVRDQYAEYFSGHGAVSWQLNMIHDDEQLTVDVTKSRITGILTKFDEVALVLVTPFRNISALLYQNNFGTYSSSGPIPLFIDLQTKACSRLYMVLTVLILFFRSAMVRPDISISLAMDSKAFS